MLGHSQENSRGMFSSENVPEHLCLSVTQADREMDSDASSHTDRHRHELARSPREQPGKGAPWALGTTTAPPSAAFVGSQD